MRHILGREKSEGYLQYMEFALFKIRKAHDTSIPNKALFLWDVKKKVIPTCTIEHY